MLISELGKEIVNKYAIICILYFAAINFGFRIC